MSTGFAHPVRNCPALEPGRRLFAVNAFFDHDDVEPASDRGVCGAEPRKTAARDQEIAGQILIRG
jgi:hypothetical protein